MPEIESKIYLRPGIPDDDNREYLPESLKHSDIVVNENGNNSQPYPHRLIERREVVIDDVEDRWYVYVPESYRPDSPTPLIISLHGGMMTGWGQAVYSSWTAVADREGFIVVFPDAHARRFWTIDIAPARVEAITSPNPEGLFLHKPPASPEHNHDLRFLLALIDLTASEYSIDRGRIFMQGMSMGNAMATQFARYFGDTLAGVAGSGGLTDPALLFSERGEVDNTAGPVPVWESRLDLDMGPTHFTGDIPSAVVMNREYWLRVNGASALPAISVRGPDNIAFYRGELADVVFRDVRNRDHGQTFDDAELVWDHFFSGMRREPDGTVTRSEPLIPLRPDRFALGVAAGRDYAWMSGERVPMSTRAFAWDAVQYHGRGGSTLSRSRAVYAPLDLLAVAFDARLIATGEGDVATLVLSDGRSVQFARGAVACVVNNRVVAMDAEAVLRDGVLCISVEWFALNLMNLRASQHSDVVYVTDHHSLLSGNMARLLSDLLVSDA
ncbi:hypothetical protein [Microbacterium sp. PA5]|uniref:hypothetical protein n=1 Tax=Microbacterium sp. PA5 TaxID=3416654 RepID=UPI003CE6BCA9